MNAATAQDHDEEEFTTPLEVDVEESASTTPTHPHGSTYPPDDNTLEAMVQYQLEHKRIPVKIERDKYTRTSDLPRSLIPSETACVACGNDLGAPELITRRGKIITLDEVVEGKLWSGFTQTTYLLYGTAILFHNLYKLQEAILVSFRMKTGDFTG